MIFCKECGTKLKEGALFCPNCGQKVAGPATVSSSKEVSSATEVTPTPAPTQTPQVKLSKKQKVVFGIIGCMILLLFGSYKLGESLTDKNRLVHQFSEALIEGDVDKLVSLISVEDRRLVVDENSVNSLLAYIERNPSFYNEIKRSLEYQSNYLDEYEEYNGSDLFTLKKTGKTLGLFDSYSIYVLPFYVTLETNYENTSISINGEVITVTDEEFVVFEHGPILPGLYKIGATHQADFATLEVTQEVELIHPGSNFSFIDLRLDGEFINVYVDDSYMAQDSTIYINGQDIDISLEEARWIGPVLLDGSLTIYATLDFPWESVKTEEVNIVGSNVYLEANYLTQDLKADLMNTVQTFAQETAEVFRNLDETSYSTVTNNYLDYVVNDIADMNDSDERWNGKYLKGEFAVDSIRLGMTGGEYFASMSAILHYDETYYYLDEEDVETKENARILNFDLVYDQENKKWLIDDTWTSYFFSWNDVIELTANN